MSLDVYLCLNKCPHCGRSDEGFSANITHNLTEMADEAGIYGIDRLRGEMLAAGIPSEHAAVAAGMAAEYANTAYTQGHGRGFNQGVEWQKARMPNNAIANPAPTPRDCIECNSLNNPYLPESYRKRLNKFTVERSDGAHVGVKPFANRDQPLEAKTIDGQLVVRIGLDALTFAAERCPKFYGYEKHGGTDKECGPYMTVENPTELANDVCRAMQREREDGSSPLTDFLDEAINEAAEQGSIGFTEDSFD